ncbi:MAG: hypothetical protein L3J21_02250 [Devosiaceae bacterium]|nr:hypothetical protein [Devosiaceae bacterium]
MILSGVGFFWQSVVLVFKNLKTAAYISILWWIVWMMVFYSSVAIFSMVYPNESFFSPLGMAINLLNIAFLLVVGSIISIRWYRFVLRQEKPTRIFGGWMNTMFFQYVFLLTVICVLLLIIVTPILVLNSIFIIPALLETGSISIFLLILYRVLLNIMYLYLALRAAIILPAIAVGVERVAIWQAWKMSQKFHLVILSSVSCLVVANQILEVLFDGLQIFSWWGANFVSLIVFSVFAVVSWFLVLVSLTLVSSFYGHYVEKKET